MLSSHTFLLRYTPPTCTLEITAKSSPLSRWMGKPLLKQLQFKLHFDDPKLPQEQRATIQGDRIQLEQLCDTVTNYVQNFLQQSSARFPLTIGTPVNSFSLKTNQTEKIDTEVASPSIPALKPIGLLTHELWLGSLSTETSGETIKLSAVQLFDLATALDEYRTEISALPELEPLPKRKVTSIWVGSAAAVILLGVGVTTAVLKQLNQSKAQVVQSAVPSSEEAQEPESSSTQEIAKNVEVKPPTPPASNDKQAPSLTLPPALASGKRLPPPPPVESPLPGSKTVPVPQGYNFPSLPQSPPSIPYTNIPSPPTPQPTESKTASLSNSSQTTTEIPTLPNLPTLPPQLQGDRPPISPEDLAAITPSKARSSETDSNSDAIAARTSTEIIPQLSEVKDYFQQRWQPQENLTNTLQYRLSLNSNGSITRIIPIGKTSEVYLDRTGMPLMGEPFVSAPEGNPQIRLVLNPDGTVQTFLEE